MIGSEVMVGAFTPFTTEISQNEKKIFEEATKGIVGVGYSPIAVSRQVVSGTNYDFFCNARAVYPDAPTFAVMVRIYAPLQGEPHLQFISRCQQ